MIDIILELLKKAVAESYKAGKKLVTEKAKSVLKDTLGQSLDSNKNQTGDVKRAGSEPIISNQQYVPGPEGSVIGGQGEVAPGYGMESSQSNIPPNYREIIAQSQQPQSQQPTQYVPGPEGSVLGGQGEVAPGYGMASPQAKVPPAYLKMIQSQTPTSKQKTPDVGFIRGMINSATGQPQPEGLEDVSQGRRTAYYAGKIIPQAIMSRIGIGQPSPEQATEQQQSIKSGKVAMEGKQQETNLQNDLSMAAERAPTLTPDQKQNLFNDLVKEYPTESTMIRRIIFPEEFYGKDAYSMPATLQKLGNLFPTRN